MSVKDHLTADVIESRNIESSISDIGSCDTFQYFIYIALWSKRLTDGYKWENVVSLVVLQSEEKHQSYGCSQAKDTGEYSQC